MPSTRAQGKRKADAADLSGSLNNRSSAKEPRRTVEPAVSVEDLDRTDLWHLIEEAATIHKGAREVIEGHREHLCDGLSESKCRAIVIELAGAYESMRDSIEHVRTARDLKPGSTFARVVAVVATPTVFTELRDRVDTAIHCLDDVDCTRVTNFSCKALHQLFSVLDDMQDAVARSPLPAESANAALILLIDIVLQIWHDRYQESLKRDLHCMGGQAIDSDIAHLLSEYDIPTDFIEKIGLLGIVSCGKQQKPPMPFEQSMKILWEKYVPRLKDCDKPKPEHA